MKKLPILLVFCLFANISIAQSVLYDNAFFNIMATNPAFAGARKEFNLVAILGNRFNGTTTPQQVSQIITLDGQVGQHSNGLGMQAFNNSSGLSLNTQGVLLDYSYRIPFGESASVALGIRAGFTTFSSIGTSQFYPYAGAGALVSADDFFVSLAEPVIVSQDVYQGLVNQKPFFASAGYSFEASDKLMLNPSFLYELNSQGGNALNLNAKLWFSRKVAFGVAFKDKGQNSLTSAAAYSKIIGTFELQASKSIRIGLSYDGNPYSDYAITGGNINTGSLFQLFFRYESTSERESTNRLKYF